MHNNLKTNKNKRLILKSSQGFLQQQNECQALKVIYPDFRVQINDLNSPLQTGKNIII